MFIVKIILVVILILLLLFLYSACKISGDISREEEKINYLKRGGNVRKKKKKVEIEIEIDLENKFFKVVDFDYLGNGGAISGGYVDKEDFLNMFNDYCEKYICLELYDNSSVSKNE